MGFHRKMRSLCNDAELIRICPEYGKRENKQETDWKGTFKFLHESLPSRPFITFNLR